MGDGGTLKSSTEGEAFFAEIGAISAEGISPMLNESMGTFFWSAS